jgi:SAM-dependent methyltransferase
MVRERVDLYGATYEQFAARIYADVRARAFGEDIGQTSWLTAEEHDLFLSWLELDPGELLLDVACGSGGPSLRAARLTGCRVHGIDLHEEAVRTARSQAAKADLAERATFERVDAGRRLSVPDGSLDAVICVDAINHLPDRAGTLREWGRILRPGGRLVFTDPIVVTGALTNEEIAVRSSIGFFLFVPSDLNEQLLRSVGFEVDEKQDHTANMEAMARKWREAREVHATGLRRIEGDETFQRQQRFLEVTALLAEERRLSRFAYAATMPGPRSTGVGTVGDGAAAPAAAASGLGTGN